MPLKTLHAADVGVTADDPMPSGGERIAIITIHGTNDTAASTSGEKWFQEGSDFTERLRRRLEQHGASVRIIPYLWSGANSTRSREAAAKKLAKQIRRTGKEYSSIHLIGHSHGGNVANTCASILNWRGSRSDHRISTITTVGTPFFENGVSRWDIFGAFALVAAVIASAFSIVITLMSGANLIVVPGLECASCTLQLVSWPVAASAIACAIVAPLAMSGTAKILRLARPLRRTATVHSIVHPNDEAIAFLSQLNRVEFEALRKGALWRSSQNPALAFGVQALTFMAALSALIAGVVLLVGGDELLGTSLWLSLTLGPYSSLVRDLLDPMTLLIMALALAPLTLAVSYGCVRLFTGLIPELLLRRKLNRSVGAAAKGMAFGVDNDERIRNVAVDSPTFSSRLITLDNELAERMRSFAYAAADKLIEKYRWSLFNISADNKMPLSAMATDAMTWDSLIHTTYFDQPEIADMIASYIVEEAASASAPSTRAW